MHAGDNANVIAMVDLPRCGLVLFRIFIAAFPGAPANVEKGEKFAQSLKPSYFVLAVATEVHAARCRIYLPREQVSGLFGLFEFITDGLGPGAAFDPAPKPARKESADVP